MGHSEENINWYAIQVRSRYEFVSAKILQAKGFNPFVPQYKSKRTWSDRKIELVLPLFPCYIFCRLNANMRLPVMTTPGVVRIVGTGKNPLPVESEEIEAIQRVVLCGCKAEPHPFITVGTRVRIEKGPMAGLQGIIQGQKNRYFIISIQLVQQSICVQLCGDDADSLTQIQHQLPDILDLYHCA